MRGEQFERLVEEAIAGLPARYRSRLRNLAFVIEPEPPLESSDLLGLYEGRPLPERSVADPFALPDRITIYQGPHERMAHNSAHLRRLIADTVWHEIAHYFGLSEREVQAAERRRKLRNFRR